MVTSEELDAIDLLCQAATAGPWYSRGSGGLHMDGTRALYEIEGSTLVGKLRRVARTQPPGHDPQDYADADFIAQARTLLPALVAELRTARKRLDVAGAATNRNATEVIVQANRARHAEAENTELRARIAAALAALTKCRLFRKETGVQVLVVERDVIRRALNPENPE